MKDTMKKLILSLVLLGCAKSAAAQTLVVDSTGRTGTCVNVDAGAPRVDAGLPPPPPPPPPPVDAGLPPPPPPPPPPPVSTTIAAVATACLAEPLRGTVRYVCDVGNDANPGTMQAPWQSYAKARSSFPGLAAGDTVAFCNGGTFPAPSGPPWANAQCTAGNPCTVRNYRPANGATALPRLISQGGTLVGLENNSSTSRTIHGIRFIGLELVGQPSATGSLVYNGVEDVEFCGMSIHGFRLAINIQGGDANSAGNNGRNSRIVVRGNTITDNNDIALLGAGVGFRYEYNLFDRNGSLGTMRNHAMYASGASGGAGPYTAVGMRIIGNEFYHNVMANGVCYGTPLVAHGLHDGLLIEGNTIQQDIGAASPGCWGIGVDVGDYATGEGFRNVTIRGNRIINVGNQSIGLTSCANCVVENNLVVQGQAFGGTALEFPSKSRNAGKGDLMMTNVTVRNNTIWFPGGQNRTGIRLDGEGTGHVVIDNVIAGAQQCFSLGLPPSSYRVDNNLCTGSWSSTVASLQAWRQLGFDLRGLTGDPMFVRAGTDFNPAAGSPLLGAGAACSSTDILGRTRTTCNIGAW